MAYIALRPLLVASARADGDGAARPRGLALAAPSGVPSPQRLGYSGVVLQRLAHHARTVLGVEHAWIAIRAPSDDGVVPVAAAGLDLDVIGTRFTEGFEGLRPAACVPLPAGGEDGGMVCLGPRTDGRELDSTDLELLAELAGLTRDVLVHHSRRELTSGDSGPEIRALVRELAEADGSTYQHSLEVAATARAVAERLGLEGVDLAEVELGALLHDVGKLRLPADVLHKPGPLNREERLLVQLHPEWGAEMVARVPGLEAVALIVRLHHERPDGRGYPHGLPLARVPLASRIVSACDAYGAMTRRRNYREPLDVDGALAELELNAGTQFDPDVVDALAEYVREPVLMAA